ncbi:MAG: hypothetical protein HDS02_01015 [Bacteroides sp.]|nr:hypothetical protein [Bacteroides sp.]
MGNEEWEMEMIDDGRISEAPFVLPDYTPHSASLHVGFSTIYASPKRIRILRVWGGGRRMGISGMTWAIELFRDALAGGLGGGNTCLKNEKISGER